MSLVEFTLELGGDVSSFTPSVQHQMQSAIAAQAGVGPSAVELAISPGSVIVDVSIQTPTATAASVQSAMASATSGPSSATAMLTNVTGVSIVVLAVVTPPTIADVPPPPPPSPSPPLPMSPKSAGASAVETSGLPLLSPSPSDPTGVIVGVVVGVIIALALALVILHRRRRDMCLNKTNEPQPAAQEPSIIEPMVSSGGLVTKALALARAAAARAAAVVEAVTAVARAAVKCCMEQQGAVPAPSIAPVKLSSASGTSYSHSSTTSSSTMVGSLTLSEGASASAKARMTRAQELLKAFELDASEITTFEKLGEGGQAVVLRGWWHGIDVAVKQPRPPKESRRKPSSRGAIGSTSVHDSFKQALRREVRALSRVRHPNIIKLHGACFEPTPMILMSYAPSGTLQDALDDHQFQTPSAIVRLLAGIARGMEAVHSHKICLLYTSPSPRDRTRSRMPSSA